MKLVIKPLIQDNLSAIRLEMIKHYFADTFRSGHYRYIRSISNMAKSLEISHLTEAQLKTMQDLIPKLWPGVQWSINLSLSKSDKAKI